ncbi:MAG: multicopper oxidase domain-containing protein [Chloroflexi bacterium]|nr:multicopper oxidase domain-containing protein [Chloroflexota bacterium]
MSFNILKSRDTRRTEAERRYVQELRDIEKAGFNRRELLRMGLVAGSAGLAALYSTPNFRPYWAHADGLTLISPPNTPFAEPLYIPPAMTPVTLNPGPTKGPNPSPSANTTVLDKGDGAYSPLGFTEANRPQHQRWEEFLPARQYESIEMPVAHSFYPAVDGMPPYPIWTFVEAATGRVAPFRINARYGEPVVHRVHNALPMDNHGFGINQTSTHLHNGHTASESDGGPTHFYDSGQFKDYHYPNVRAGFASTHPTSTLNGRTVQGDVRETMGFLWFHDHRFDFTSQNVYKGLAAFYTLFSDDIELDCNDETRGLRLPSGPYDIPMIFADKVFDLNTGEMLFDRFNLDGILGDKYTVNGKIQPFLEVKKRKYRFRLLDGGPSRVYEFFLSNGQPFVQISNDGNLLPRPLTRTSIRMSVAERVDVIVDFSKAKVGDRIYLQNRLEQTNGRGPTGKFIAPTNIVEFRVAGPDAVDDPSRIPDKLLDLPARRAAAQTREWSFGRSNGAWQINGEFFDPNVIRAAPKQNTAEIWTFKSGGGWQHPVHIHFEEMQLLSRNGKAPPIDEIARKDVVRMGQAALGTQGVGETKLFIQFRDFLGDYPLHCHNTVHEDHAMMLRWQIVP